MKGGLLNPTHDCCVHTFFFPRMATEGHIIHPINMTNVVDIQPRTVRFWHCPNPSAYQLSPVEDLASRGKSKCFGASSIARGYLEKNTKWISCWDFSSVLQTKDAWMEFRDDLKCIWMQIHFQRANTKQNHHRMIAGPSSSIARLSALSAE